MSQRPPGLQAVREKAVEACITHVEAGGLPFVRVVVDGTGVISEFGVNRVRATRDPTAHAEILAMNDAMGARGFTSLAGTTLLATGEPCDLCYRFAINRRVDAIYVAVDRDEVAGLGFDYRSSHPALGITDYLRAGLVRHLPVTPGHGPPHQVPAHRTRHER